MAGTIAAFLGLLAINAIYSSDTHSSFVGEIYDLTFSEKLVLADAARKAGNWERAAYMLESARDGLDGSDPRARALNARLDKIRKQQVDNDLAALNKTG